MRNMIVAVSVAGALAVCASGCRRQMKAETPSATAKAPAVTEMTMMTYNVRIGCGINDPFSLPEGGLGRLPACAEVIRGVDPDWVAIQEIDRNSKRVGHVDQTAELARMCGMKGTFVKKVDKQDGEYGLAVLSKEKPISVSKILIPGSFHTRCIEIVEFTNYIVACTHFPLKEFLRVRAAEIACLNLVGRAKPVFLAGDFNAPLHAPSIDAITKSFTILSDAERPTFRSDKPSQCIDYIMVDNAHTGMVETVSREVIAAPEATDHCAVVVKARIRR